MKTYPAATCGEIAAAFRQGNATARTIVEASLARIEAHDGRVNAFTDVLAPAPSPGPMRLTPRVRAETFSAPSRACHSP